MPDFELNADEYEVMRTEQVRYGGTMANYTSDLVLTNEHIILVRRGVFGGAKPAEYFPLRNVKVALDRPQAIARDDTLEVHFVDRQEQFVFLRQRRKEVKIWAENIIRLVVGDAESLRKIDDKALPGAAFLAEAARDTFDAVKRGFRSPSVFGALSRVSTRCSSCGAALSGVGGRVVRCQFCGTEQTLQSGEQ